MQQHAVGHLSALARTTPSTFLLAAADTTHHPAALRPSPHVPLPPTLNPTTTTPRTSPLYTIAPLHGHADFDLDTARASVEKLAAWDGREDVLVVLAHDASLLGTVGVWPGGGEANGWREAGWKGRGRWGFLGEWEKERV